MSTLPPPLFRMAGPLLALVALTAARPAQALPPGLGLEPLAATSPFAPERVQRVERKVVATATEVDRQEGTKVQAAMDAAGEDLVVTLAVTDTCRARQVETVELTTIEEGQGGAPARRSYRWIGVGAFAVAALGAVAPIETSDGLSPVVGRVLLVGGMSGVGGWMVWKAHAARPEVVSVRQESNPLAWRTVPCETPSRTSGYPVRVTVETGIGASQAVGSGTSDAAGRVVVRRASLSATVAQLPLAQDPPYLNVYVGEKRVGGGPLPAPLVAALRPERLALARERLPALLQEADAAARRGDYDDAVDAIAAAESWCASEAEKARVEAAYRRVLGMRDAEARAGWARVEAQSLAVCRRVRPQVAAFEARVRRLAQSDPEAAEAWIAEHRDGLEAELAEMSEAVEALAGVYAEMEELGLEVDERVAFARRVSAACGQ